MSELPPCQANIYKDGTLVMMTHTIPAREMETWVKSVATVSGQPVDWHFAGGHACILALGDLTKVRQAIHELLPEHNRLQKEATRKFLPVYDDFEPSYTLYADEECNPMHEYARQMNLAPNDPSENSNEL